MQGLWSSGVGEILESGWPATQYTIPRFIYHMDNCSFPLCRGARGHPCVAIGVMVQSTEIVECTLLVSQRGTGARYLSRMTSVDSMRFSDVSPTINTRFATPERHERSARVESVGALIRVKCAASLVYILFE
jgi:hypothetical protein